MVQIELDIDPIKIIIGIDFVAPRHGRPALFYCG